MPFADPADAGAEPRGSPAPPDVVGALSGVADRLGLTPTGVLGLAAACVVAGSGAWWALRPPPAPPVETLLPGVEDAGGLVPAASTTSSPATIVVHVDGAVRRPGVHELAAGSRVVDAVEAAGGLTADADTRRVNLAALLADGVRVWIPRMGEDGPAAPLAVTGTPPGTSGGVPDAPVDVNRADAAQLETLPGVGPAIAAAIVETREARGGFASVDELLEVPGIGPARLARLRDRVTV